MIEAVNSVISNAQATRAVASQAATLNSFAADQAAIETVARAPVAPYVSPFVSIDTNFDTAVLQIRDSDTGDVLTQFPSEPTLQQRQAQAARQEAARQEAARQTAPETQAQSQRTEQTVAEVPQSTFQATVIAQETQALQSSTAGAAQAAVAALSAGAQSAIGSANSGSTNVTA